MGREGTSTKFYNSAFLRNKGTCLWFQFQENMDFDVVVAALPALAACPPNYFIVKQVLSILMIITNPPPHQIFWWMCEIVFVCGKEEIYFACFQTIPMVFMR